MTEQEVRLEVLRMLVPTASRLDITRDALVSKDGPAEKMVEFVMRPPATAKKG